MGIFEKLKLYFHVNILIFVLFTTGPNIVRKYNTLSNDKLEVMKF